MRGLSSAQLLAVKVSSPLGKTISLTIDAANEFVRRSYLSQFLSLGDWNEMGKASLARGMANAINRAEARCGENFAPGEYAVMMARATQAAWLGLEPYAPDALNSEKVLDRVSRCLRFELKL